MGPFRTKSDARQASWDVLQEERLARYPFPPHGRIPNFAGAEKAAIRLLDHPLLERVRTMKVNPDSPQRPLREEALRRGIRLLVPTPRLKDDFMLFDPAVIPAEDWRRSSMSTHFKAFAQRVALSDLPEVDAVVVGSVAVTREGLRCGKGHGYADLEHAMLHALGQSPVPVLTTVHARQVVSGFPTEPHDLRLQMIGTPDEIIEVPGDLPAGHVIQWDLLDRKSLEDMPVLQELWRREQEDGGMGGGV